jgi:ribosome-associated heat shock protein Hsp15
MTESVALREDQSCRADLWLWRARFFKTRGLAARVIEAGGARVTRGALKAPLDKPSRQLRAGDIVAFPLGEKWVAARVERLGERRGPASEARQLYTLL